MNRPYFHAACATVLLLAISGCVSRSPVLESQLGQSVTMLKAQQTINPEASRNSDAAAGMDGKAGKSAYDSYQKSFRNPEAQQNSFTIGVGSSR